MKYNTEVGLYTEPSYSKSDIKNPMTGRTDEQPFYLIPIPLKHTVKAVAVLTGGTFLESIFEFKLDDIVFHILPRSLWHIA